MAIATTNPTTGAVEREYEAHDEAEVERRLAAAAEAVQALRETDGPFDLIFNDIDKHQYPGSIPVIIEKLRAKLGDLESVIGTVRGVGYRFELVEA